MNGWGLPVGERPPARRSPTPDNGATLVELTVAVGLVAALLAAALPATAAVAEASRVRNAAAYMAARFREARERAVMGATAVGVVFETTAGQTTFRMCVDGNGNGVRRSDVDDGEDRCLGAAETIGQSYEGIRFAVDPALRDPDGEPGSSDAVRFGRGEVASFSPAGTCTSGSLYLRSPGGLQLVVRIAGTTARTRVLRYDPQTRGWRDP